MYEKQEGPPHEWSVHAEVTISHNPGQEIPLTTHTEQNGNGLRMVYTWTTNPTGDIPAPTPKPPETYGFQRGGMVFTSVPPRARTTDSQTRLGVHDSGYNSELLSPSSGQSPRRPILPYNRRCRSTCSIVLSTAINTDHHSLTSTLTQQQQPTYPHCGRTQSLRCQTPSTKSDRRDSYYGCGDPWCYHTDEFNRRCSPVLESCEECSVASSSGVGSKRTSRANTFTTHFCTRVPERNQSSPPKLGQDYKDMASQTVETREKCTSPFQKVPLTKDNEKNLNDTTATEGKKKIVRKLSDRRRRPHSRRNSNTNTLSPPVLSSGDNADNRKSSKRITRSPAMNRGRSPRIEKKSPSRDDPKKQRTVHIDVYCTGSDDCDSDSSDSTTESDAETHSSPQTVFESENVRISQRRAETTELPYSLRKFLESKESDEETAYPSALSSYATIGDLDSSLSSVPPSLSTSTVPDYDSSAAATSCKDTVSDFETLIQRRFNLVPDESEYFIPRRLKSVEESTGGGGGTVLPSDSFEYDDSADRERIQEMERLWEESQAKKCWKSPNTERKFMLQQQKMREYLEKRIRQRNELKKESETESADDDSEQGWSFIRPPPATTATGEILKRDDTATVRRQELEQLKINKHDADLNDAATKQFTAPPPPTKTPMIKINPTSSQNIVQSSSSYTSLIPTKSALQPFTTVPGKGTEQLITAQKFGTVIGAIRKPGHHIGPAKNPDCLCNHCREFYQASGSRNRTRSMGDSSIEFSYNWREILKPRHNQNKPLASDF